ncbi:MAG: hemolysin family protein [Corynebacterium sp.]|nr:hemolysin family protein [Corynebacterium sp.]
MEDLLLASSAIIALIFATLATTTEEAVRSVSRARVDELVKEETPGAKNLARVLRHKPTVVNLLVLLGNLLMSLGVVLTAALFFSMLESETLAITVTVIVSTLIIYVILGVFSRTIGRKNPYQVSLRSAVFLSVLGFVLGPITKLLVRVGNKVTPGDNFREGPYGSESELTELLEMVDLAEAHGVVEEDERRMMQAIVYLGQTTARSVMVPRPEMVWIESGKTAGQATALCVRSGHSRIPVIGESVDDIVGIVYLKDLVQQTYHNTDGGRSVTVDSVMRKPIFVPDSKMLDDLLEDMQRQRNHIAVLIDEYGAVSGLISIEDILEEIVGEIADEYDQAEQAPEEKLEDNTWRVLARMSLEDLQDLAEEELDFDLEFDEDIEEEVETVGGLLAYKLGRVPLPGSTVETSGLRLTAEGKRDRRGRMRITTVLVEFKEYSSDN